MLVHVCRVCLTPASHISPQTPHCKNNISKPWLIDKKTFIMTNLLYIIAVILVICWAVGFFAYGTGGIIHILLVIAVIALILGVIRRA